MILKSNLKAKQPLQFNPHDVRLASYILDAPIGELITLLSFVEEVTERRVTSLMKVKSITSFNRYYKYFEDSTFILDTPRKDWVLLCLIYIISTAPAESIQLNMDKFFEFVRAWLNSRKEINEIKSKIASLHRDLYDKYSIEGFVFFNSYKLKQKAKEYNITAHISSKELMLEWKDITITLPKEMQLFYPRILLFLRVPDFYINKFVIFARNFYYDSDWRMLPHLHPNLNDADMLANGKNSFIEFLPLQRYDLVMESFNDLILCKSGFTFTSPSVCVETYNKLSILWDSIDINKSTEEKSKELFTKFKEYNGTN